MTWPDTGPDTGPDAGPGTGLVRSRRLAGVLMAVYLVVVVLIVFAPTADVPSASVRWMSALLQAFGAPTWVSPGVMEFVSNVLLFVPLSLLGSTFRPRWGWGRWLLAGLAGTLLIELAQLVLLSGRSAALVDVVANTLGAVVGYVVVVLVVGRRAHRG